MGWLAATDGYEVALVDRKLACRRTGGRPLKTVPKPVRDHEVTQGLVQTQEWLDRHDLACRAEVEKWMIRSLPVPVAVLTQVWPDPSWRAPLARRRRSIRARLLICRASSKPAPRRGRIPARCRWPIA